MIPLREQYPDLPSLLQAIRHRPANFLGQKTIFGLSILLMGIKLAEDYHELSAPDRIQGFNLAKFEEWVESKYNPKRLSHNSRSLAGHLAGSDEAGFDLWFSWYDEYSNIA